MDNIKRSFDKVKEDMDSLRNEVNSIKSEIRELRDSMVDMCEIINNLEQNGTSKNSEINFDDSSRESSPPKNSFQNSSTDISTHQQGQDRNNYYDSTQGFNFQTGSTDNSTDNSRLDAQKDQNLSISTRNQGVPTDRQTNRQTNRQTVFSPEPPHNQALEPKNSFNDAVGILDSLDNIKKDLRLKFKRLTHQEFLVFSTLYQLTDQHGYSDYRTLSKKLGLSGSSIRDYIGRLVEKGIPVEKNKANNKNIQLNISSELKKIASLPTIMELRDI